jgi:hypothetical protein
MVGTGDRVQQRIRIQDAVHGLEIRMFEAEAWEIKRATGSKWMNDSYVYC